MDIFEAPPLLVLFHFHAVFGKKTLVFALKSELTPSLGNPRLSTGSESFIRWQVRKGRVGVTECEDMSTLLAIITVTDVQSFVWTHCYLLIDTSNNAKYKPRHSLLGTLYLVIIASNGVNPRVVLVVRSPVTVPLRRLEQGSWARVD